MRELELLAPARTADIGIAAIDCGADAVYIAGPEFGARQAAGNSIDDIRRLCAYAHRFGARIFAALNTIIYADEMERACGMMLMLQDAGVDAIIVQDLGLAGVAMQRVRDVDGGCAAKLCEEGLEIPLHASTQCAIRTPEKAAFLERLGFSRLILERELSLGQISAIRAAVDCELEFFVHGAVCVCYSGQCYISEHIAGRSANRGACIQACRSLYNLVDGEGRRLVQDKPLLSLKDYRLKDRLGDLAAAGISSFKVEGRLKNISYVRNVVREYSLALDSLVERFPEKYSRASFGRVSGGFVPDSSKTFNRGYTELWLDGRRGQWASDTAATSMGEPIGTVESVSPDGTMIRIRPSRPGLKLNNGDGFCFVSGGREVTGFRGDVCEGLTVRCKPVRGLHAGAEIYRNSDTAFEKVLETDMPERSVRVELTVTVQDSGDGCILVVSAVTEDGRRCRKSAGEGADPARNVENMKNTIVAQLSRSSGHYSFSVLDFQAERLPFLPVSAVNALRRDLAAELDSMPVQARPLYRNPGQRLRVKGGPDVLETVPGQDKAMESMRPEADSFAAGRTFTYKDNVANPETGELLSSLGAASVEPAYEIAGQKGAELMRTRYCIRYQFGRCPAHHGRKWPDRLFLENNGRLFELGFDCRNCEMTVFTPLRSPQSRK